MLKILFPTEVFKRTFGLFVIIFWPSISHHATSEVSCLGRTQVKRQIWCYFENKFIFVQNMKNNKNYTSIGKKLVSTIR